MMMMMMLLITGSHSPYKNAERRANNKITETERTKNEERGGNAHVVFAELSNSKPGHTTGKAVCGTTDSI